MGEVWVEIVNEIFDARFISVILRILASMLCGGIIGAERGKSNQPAGMRTYMLVCLGAAVVMITGEYVYREYGAGDPSRLGAQVISGIGFLGAGSIVISGKSRIRGLTTAAGLWVSACIGLVVGIGFIKAGIAATMAVYIVIAVLKPIEDVMLHRQNAIEVTLSFEDFGRIEEIQKELEGMKVKVGSVQVYNEDKKMKGAIILVTHYPKKEKDEIVRKLLELKEIKGVKYLF